MSTPYLLPVTDREHEEEIELAELGVAIAHISDGGDIECPHCHTILLTPIKRNPFNGNEEKLIVQGKTPATCRVCREDHVLTPAAAVRHNLFWFPNDPDFLTEAKSYTG